MEIEKLNQFNFKNDKENYTLKVREKTSPLYRYYATLDINDIDKAIEFLQNVKKQLE